MQKKNIYPWVVVGLLWFVALLDYHQQANAFTMKQSMMIDIVELKTQANFGRLMAVSFGFMLS